jgi:aldehyde dehydrogenase
LGRALVTNQKSIEAFTGSTTTGRLVMQYATENIISLRWNYISSKYFMKSVGDADDDSLIKQ